MKRWDRRTLDELPLFAPPAQRTSATSRAAAASIAPHAATKRAQVLDYLRTAGGRTNEQLANELAMRLSTVTARVNELTQLGLVRDSGQTRRTTSGRQAAVWIAK